jgi:hypothetical protein
VLASLRAEHYPRIGLDDVLVIRHSFSAHPEGLHGPEDLTEARVLEYTRWQSRSTRSFPAHPPRYWVVLIADGKQRSRLFAAYENHGEVESERTDSARSFDLRPSAFLAPLANRLVVEWSSPRRWHRRAINAAGLPVVEIADRDKAPFPGFDPVLLTHHESKEMVESHRYTDWRAALSQVQGIYLITDSSTGKHYVGKADGSERILGRWRGYAKDGHGGNVVLQELARASSRVAGAPSPASDHSRHFVYSILRVFGPSTSSSEVDGAETHYKRALMTREFGLNRN